MGSHDAFVLSEPERPYGAEQRAPVRKVSSPEALIQAIRRHHGVSSIKLGDRLLELGLLGPDTLERALELQRAAPNRHLGEILSALGLVSGEDVQLLVCEQLDIPVVDLDQFPLETAVLRLVPGTLALECRACPLARFEDGLIAAFANPFDTAALERLRFGAQMPVVPVAASRDALDRALHARYGAGILYAEPVLRHAGHPQPTPRFDRDGARINPLDAEVVDRVERMLADACAAGATAIHLDASAGAGELAVRFRNDGALSGYAEIPRHLRAGVVARIKAMAGLEVFGPARAQEGRVARLEHGPSGVALRVMALPTREGREHIVIEIVHLRAPMALEDLGMTAAVSGAVKAMAAKPQGLLIVAGPPGCGRTTTAHAVLNLVDAGGAKIWTAESPVETIREGASQIEVNGTAGWDYASAVRAIVRADPDVILIGDVRDRETAALAVQAALGGRRIVSVMAARSAAEAIVRLLDLGVDAYSLSAALLGALSQRLVRRLCPACRVSRPLAGPEAEALLREYCEGAPLDAGAVRAEWTARFGSRWLLHSAPGCEVCRGSGYHGRTGVFELMPGSAAVRALVRSRGTASALEAAALREGMRTLKRDGIEKALEGQCDLLAVRAALA